MGPARRWGRFLAAGALLAALGHSAAAHRAQPSYNEAQTGATFSDPLFTFRGCYALKADRYDARATITL